MKVTFKGMKGQGLSTRKLLAELKQRRHYKAVVGEASSGEGGVPDLPTLVIVTSGRWGGNCQALPGWGSFLFSLFPRVFYLLLVFLVL